MLSPPSFKHLTKGLSNVIAYNNRLTELISTSGFLSTETFVRHRPGNRTTEMKIKPFRGKVHLPALVRCRRGKGRAKVAWDEKRDGPTLTSIQNPELM